MDMIRQSFFNIIGNNAKGVGTDKIFYCVFFMNTQCIADEKYPTVAGVSVQNGIKLMYNPLLWKKLSPAQQIAIIEHEFSHVIKEHCTSPKFKECSPFERRIWNIAMDCEINQRIPEMEEINAQKMPLQELFSECPDLLSGNTGFFECITPTTLAKMLEIDHVPADKTSEFYFNLIKSSPKCQEMEKNYLDSHEFIGEEVTEVTREEVRNALKNTAKAYPGFLASCKEVELIKDLVEGRINWKEELRRFNSFVDKSVIVHTRKKVNRRYGLQCAGKKTDPDLKLAVIIDVSGSMTSLLAEVYSELASMYTTCKKLTVYEVDTQLVRKYEYDPNESPSCAGGGGTLYNPGIEAALEDQVDAMLYIGDMDCFDNEQIKDPEVPFMWVCMTQQEPPANFGFKVRAA